MSTDGSQQANGGDKTVREIMLSLDEYATIDSECTIAQALVALSKAQLGLTYDRHHHRAVLVLDRAGQVVGKLSHWAILKSLEPSPLDQEAEGSLLRAGLDDRFINGLRERVRGMATSLESLCRTAGQVRVRDAMEVIGASIAEDASLTEAIRQMVNERCQSLLVRRSGRVIGILRLSDVFEEIADLIRRSECEQSSV